MEREIKFRGKRTDNNDFVHGYYVKDVNDRHYIYPCDYSKHQNAQDYLVKAFEIKPETLGQFVGLKDKNDVDIYEKDIVKVHYFKLALGENLGVYEDEETLIGVINFDELSISLENIIGDKWCEYTCYSNGEGSCKLMHLHDVYEGSCDAEIGIEVIGNIFDNPDLIK